MATLVDQLAEAKTALSNSQEELKAAHAALAAEFEKSNALSAEVSALTSKLSAVSAELTDVKANFEAKAKEKALVIAVESIGQTGAQAVSPSPLPEVNTPKADDKPKTFEQHFAAKVSSGMSKANAVRACISEFPKEFAEAKARGIRI